EGRLGHEDAKVEQASGLFKLDRPEACHTKQEVLMRRKPAVEKLLDRRSFFRSATALGAGLALTNEELEAYPQNVQRNSKPSELKITDLRVATVARAPMTCPLIRIDTNQGLYGLGEVRDGASKNYALVLKSRLLGENPCNVDSVVRT